MPLPPGAVQSIGQTLESLVQGERLVNIPSVLCAKYPINNRTILLCVLPMLYRPSGREEAKSTLSFTWRNIIAALRYCDHRMSSHSSKLSFQAENNVIQHFIAGVFQNIQDINDPYPVYTIPIRLRDYSFIVSTVVASSFMVCLFHLLTQRMVFNPASTGVPLLYCLESMA